MTSYFSGPKKCQNSPKRKTPVWTDLNNTIITLVRINKLPYSQKQKKGKIFSLKSKKGWKLQSPSTRQVFQNEDKGTNTKERKNLMKDTTKN
jgi:hypothetical protein